MCRRSATTPIGVSGNFRHKTITIPQSLILQPYLISQNLPFPLFTSHAYNSWQRSGRILTRHTGNTPFNGENGGKLRYGGPIIITISPKIIQKDEFKLKVRGKVFLQMLAYSLLIMVDAPYSYLCNQILILFKLYILPPF